MIIIFKCLLTFIKLYLLPKLYKLDSMHEVNLVHLVRSLRGKMSTPFKSMEGVHGHWNLANVL